MTLEHLQCMGRQGTKHHQTQHRHRKQAADLHIVLPSYWLMDPLVKRGDPNATSVLLHIARMLRKAHLLRAHAFRKWRPRRATPDTAAAETDTEIREFWRRTSLAFR